MPLSQEKYDVVIIGGGIAGNALATVLARTGRAVLLLERSTVYRDKVRGEVFHAWGVAEAQRLGVYETLMRSGGIHHSRSVPYDETVEPAEAEAAALPLDSLLPGVPGTLGVGHPRACEALSQVAIANGARVLRGVESPEAQLGHPPTVRYLLNGAVYVAKCRLVIGADGRESAIRRRAGITLHVTQPRLLMAGMLVDELDSWPEHQMTIGTEGDRVFFVVPQGAGRVRLYLLWSCDHRHRFAGAGGPRAFSRQLCPRLYPQTRLHSESETGGPLCDLSNER